MEQVCFCLAKELNWQNMIRIEKTASKKDLFEIMRLINIYASQGFMLPKNMAQILQLKEYLIAKENENIVGGAGLKEWTNGLVEIVSLTVDPRMEGKGIGTALVEKCLLEARNIGYKKIFTLTIRPNIFLRLGFEKVSIKTFPEKIWNDCKDCPKNASGPDDPKCNEIALMCLLR